MKYAYFPGCSIHHSTAKEYEKSCLAVSRELGIELEEIPGWNCCGSIDAVYSYDPNASLALAARNFTLAEKLSSNIVTLCSACYFTLSRANKILQSDSEASEQVRKTYNVQTGSDGVKVRHFLDILVNDVGYDVIAAHVRTPLKGLKVASYYGCLLVRPPGLGSFDDPEHPRSLEKVVETLGAKSVELQDKTRCCGASLAITHEETMIELSKQILQNAKAAGADCIVTVCPLCQFNLDAKQTDIEARLGTKLNIPVLFLTQLMGLAFGLSDRELEIGKNFTKFRMSKSNADGHAVEVVAEAKHS